MSVAIRPARADDARFLAASTLIAHRSHLKFCSFDLLFDTEPERLEFFARMANAEPASYAHHSGYLIAELDGAPAAALCGFTAGDHVRPEFLAALGPVLRALGIDEAQQAARTARVAAWETCPYPSKPGEWVIEWVGTLPEFRRRGLTHALLEAILARGRATGHTVANIAHLIGNDAAQRAYEKVGFVAWQDVCHPEFERATGALGIRRLRRNL